VSANGSGVYTLNTLYDYVVTGDKLSVTCGN
jgi:hypothetical protein